MRAGATTDWFKMMAETVRGAFMLPVQGEAPPSQEGSTTGQEGAETHAPAMENGGGAVGGHGEGFNQTATL